MCVYVCVCVWLLYQSMSVGTGWYVSISNTRQAWNINHAIMETQAFCKACWERLIGSGWTKGQRLSQWQTPLPRPTPTHSYSNSSGCEHGSCPWMPMEVTLWLFYELHYWFPIQLRTENVIMHRSHSNNRPTLPNKPYLFPSSLLRFLVFYLVAFHPFIFACYPH